MSRASSPTCVINRPSRSNCNTPISFETEKRNNSGSVKNNDPEYSLESVGSDPSVKSVFLNDNYKTLASVMSNDKNDKKKKIQHCSVVLNRRSRDKPLVAENTKSVIC